jgi:hypothetical protein
MNTMFDGRDWAMGLLGASIIAAARTATAPVLRSEIRMEWLSRPSTKVGRRTTAYFRESVWWVQRVAVNRLITKDSGEQGPDAFRADNLHPPAKGYEMASIVTVVD